MQPKIRIGIAGYGNLGRGGGMSVAQSPDMGLVGVLTRRDPASVSLLNAQVPVHPQADIVQFQDQIDVLILCGGSKDDLPVQGPAMAALFNTVDSFDTHATIPEYYAALDEAAKPAGKTALLSVGWDPGLFSLNRLYGEAILPVDETYTFWGKGLSQGHSDAVRRVPGVKAGVQYTIPAEPAIERVRSGELPQLTTREKHRRECYVVLADGAVASVVVLAIVSMPHYGADYYTAVHIITEEELHREHAAMPHGGVVIRSGTSGAGTTQVVEY